MTDEPKRDKSGRWLPGKSANEATKWGPDNPSPKSPGRPKRDAWLGELEERLKDSRLREALAARVLHIALKGGERTALRALDMVQSRIGGPVVARISAEVNENCGVLVTPHGQTPDEWIAAAKARSENAKKPGSEDEE